MRTLCVLSVFALAACGGGDPSNPGGNNNGVQNFTATIDGQPWNAEVAPSAINASAGTYVITAFRFTGAYDYTLTLDLHDITGPGTYPLGVTLGMFGGIAIMSQPGSGWMTRLTGAAGQIVITTLSATQMVGTFSFVADGLVGTTGTRTVSQGQFDIPVTGTGGLAPANQGSSMSATIGGASYVASQVATVLTAGGTPTLTVVSNTVIPNSTGRSVTLGVTDMTAAGTYALSSTAPVRTIQVGGEPGNPSAAWTSALTGGTGSITISSVTAHRILGTFTGTVMGAGGGASASMTISGTFSLGRGP